MRADIFFFVHSGFSYNHLCFFYIKDSKLEAEIKELENFKMKTMNKEAMNDLCFLFHKIFFQMTSLTSETQCFLVRF